MFAHAVLKTQAKRAASEVTFDLRMFSLVSCSKARRSSQKTSAFAQVGTDSAYKVLPDRAMGSPNHCEITVAF